MRIGLSQDQLAQMVGITRKSQQRYEAAESAPDVSYLQAVEQAGIDSQYVLNGRRVSPDPAIVSPEVRRAAVQAFKAAQAIGSMTAEQFEKLFLSLCDEASAPRQPAQEGTSIGNSGTGVSAKRIAKDAQVIVGGSNHVQVGRTTIKGAPRKRS